MARGLFRRFAVATAGMQPKGPGGEVVDSASVGQLFIAGLVPATHEPKAQVNVRRVTCSVLRRS